MKNPASREEYRRRLQQFRAFVAAHQWPSTSAFGVVYLLTNKITGKQYVGQTVQKLVQRMQRHGWPTNAGRMAIAAAIWRDGMHNFTVDVLCECATRAELDSEEARCIREYNTISPHGYNLSASTEGRRQLTQESKDKISRANLGQRRSEETKQRLSDSHLGFVVSEATKKKISATNRGRRGSDLCYARAAEASAKTYCLIDPQGERVIATNMRRFAMEHGLGPASMCDLSRGRIKVHRGWRLDVERHAVLIQPTARRAAGGRPRKPDSVAAQIEKFIAEAATPCSVADLQTALPHCHPSTVRAVVQQLKEDGKLRRVAMSTYALPGTGT